MKQKELLIAESLCGLNFHFVDFIPLDGVEFS